MRGSLASATCFLPSPSWADPKHTKQLIRAPPPGKDARHQRTVSAARTPPGRTNWERFLPIYRRKPPQDQIFKPTGGAPTGDGASGRIRLERGAAVGVGWKLHEGEEEHEAGGQSEARERRRSSKSQLLAGREREKREEGIFEGTSAFVGCLPPLPLLNSGPCLLRCATHQEAHSLASPC